MTWVVALATAALVQADATAVAAVTRGPEPALLSSAEDWRGYYGPKFDDVLLELEAESPERPRGDVETVPLDLRCEDVGLLRLQELEDAPVLFPTVSRVVFGAPSFLLEGLSAIAAPRGVSVGGQRLFDRGTGEDDLAWIFGRTLLKRELSFLGSLGDSYVVTPGVELGVESVDKHRFDRLQQRVLYDSVKRAWRERYAIPAMDVDVALNAVQSGSWVDYLVVPGLVSAYTAKFGLERKFHLGPDVKLQLSVEKGTRFYKVATQDHGGRLGAFSLTLFDLPLSAIVSVDSLDTGIGFGFVGIGTDLNAMIEAVNGARGTSRRDD